MEEGGLWDRWPETWTTAAAIPPKGKEHPLVEKGERAGLEGRVFLRLRLSAPRLSSACPPKATYPHLNVHLQSRRGPSSFKSRGVYQALITCKALCWAVGVPVSLNSYSPCKRSTEINKRALL